MSLNKLARGVVFVAALASAVPNAGCNKTEQSTHGKQSAQAASTPLRSWEKEFPECGEGMKGGGDGGSIYIKGPFRSSEESWECVRDQLRDRDCRAIREERRRIIAEIPSLFQCVDGEIKLTVRPSQLVVLADFDSAESSTKGDCSKTSIDARVRVQRVLDRMACNEEGKPHEKLGWGDAEGGRIYNPCAGGC